MATTDNHFTTTGHPIWGKATREEHIAYQMPKMLRKCVYFMGIQQGRCLAGVPYPRGTALPCWRDIPDPPDCALSHFPSEEEARALAEERVDAIAASMQKMNDRFATKQCLHCGASWTSRTQIGPCVYAYPCGHRQYQGTLPKEER